MHTTLKRALALTAGLALAIGLSACSSDSGSPKSSASGSAKPSASGDAAAMEKGTFAKDDKTIVFAVLPDKDDSEQNAKPIAEWIGKITGKKVDLFEATDYTAVIQGLAAGQIDVAQISAFTYYQSQNAGAEIEPIGAQITKEGKPAGYYSVALKHPEAGASALKDFADQPVCFVNPTSTSGRAIPASQLKKAGVTVSKENTVFGEKHDLTAAKIADGTDCKVGFAQDSDADPLIKDGKLQEIERFLVPGAPIVAQAGLPKDVKKELSDALVGSTQKSITDAGIELNDFLKESWFGFEGVDDKYYDTIRTVCEQVADEVEACRA